MTDTAKYLEAARHRMAVEAAYQEVTALRLDEFDPDWRTSFTSFEAAERFYRRELEQLGGNTVNCGTFEPRDYVR